MTARAEEIVEALTRLDRTVAVAESLTGGLVVARLVDVPGASRVLRGGIVAYMTDLKADLLGVDADLLARVGAVHADVAREMALGAARRLHADYAVSTTGVAGPDPADGRAAGTVFIAAIGPGPKPGSSSIVEVHELHLDPSIGRQGVRSAAADAALDLLAELATH